MTKYQVFYRLVSVCLQYNCHTIIISGVCYLRLDFESFDINGLSDSVERTKSTTTLTECQDTFKITVSSWMNSDIIIYIKSYWHVCTFYACDVL